MLVIQTGDIAVMRLKTTLAAVLALTLPLALSTTGAAQAKKAAAAKTVTLTGTDSMKFTPATIAARPGERIKVILKTVSALPKIAMAHNVVVLKKGTNLDAFINASATARATDFIAPAFKKQIVAATPMAGAGETVDVTFAAPSAPGRYDFVCSFPGHFAGGMRGVLVVK